MNKDPTAAGLDCVSCSIVKTHVSDAFTGLASSGFKAVHSIDEPSGLYRCRFHYAGLRSPSHPVRVQDGSYTSITPICIALIR